jgi:hypothetical protein
VATRKPPKTQISLAILNFNLAKSLILASQKKQKKEKFRGFQFLLTWHSLIGCKRAT